VARHLGELLEINDFSAQVSAVLIDWVRLIVLGSGA
jgi:hypothetical protein